MYCQQTKIIFVANLEFSYPDVSESNRIPVILKDKRHRAMFSDCIFRYSDIECAASQADIILDKHSVVQDGHPWW